MSLIAVLRSRTFWTWYLFAGMVMATVLLTGIHHQLVLLGLPATDLPDELLPAFTRAAIANGPFHGWLMAGFAVAATLVAVGVQTTRWTVEVRRWAMLAAGGLAVVTAAILFGGYVLAVHVLPPLKLASLAG